MSRSEMLEEFFRSDYGKGLLKQASTQTKVAYDQDSYWEGDKQGPTQDEVSVAHPGGGSTTAVSNSGGGGEGLYEVPGSDVKATDAKVETIVEQHQVHDDVARKAPTGVQGSKIKGLTRSSKGTKKVVDARVQQLKKARLEKLVRIADKLDELNLKDEAEIIDEIIREEAGVDGAEAPAEEAMATESEEAKVEETAASE